MEVTKRTMSIRTYTELTKLRTFRDRFEYLKLDGLVGEETFGFERYLNQQFYHSFEWRRIRDQVIARDLGCDLAMEGYEIHEPILIHHMNPITAADIRHSTEFLADPDYLICVTKNTHNAIHYGDASMLITEPIERTPYDTSPWKRG